MSIWALDRGSNARRAQRLPQRASVAVWIDPFCLFFFSYLIYPCWGRLIRSIRLVEGSDLWLPCCSSTAALEVKEGGKCLRRTCTRHAEKLKQSSWVIKSNQNRYRYAHIAQKADVAGCNVISAKYMNFSFMLLRDLQCTLGWRQCFLMSFSVSHLWALVISW